MRVLATGAAGFVGGHLKQRLATAGHDVYALYRESAPRHAEPRGCTPVRGNLAASVELPAPLDAIVHAAAAIPARVPDPVSLERINTLAAESVCEHAARAGVKTIVNLSSMAVYGEVLEAEVAETTPPNAPAPYGRSKLAAEARLNEWAGAEPERLLISIRLPGVVGKGSHDNFLSDTRARIAAGSTVEASNPDALFNNVVHVDELTGFILTLLESSRTGAYVANVAAREPLQIREVIDLMIREAGRDVAVHYRASTRSPFIIRYDTATSLGFVDATVADSIVRFVRDAPVGAPR